MGRAKQKKQLFFATHPICFNCGAGATTIDHVPSRECFIGRVGPEGFEFPACGDCNKKVAQIEQAVALLIRLADFSENLDEGQFAKLVRGVKNNTPELLPSDFSTLREKRNWLKNIGLEPRRGETIADVPVMKMRPGWRDAFHAFARKLLAALYYKEMGRLLPNDSLMRTIFTQFVDGQGRELVEKLLTMLPEIRVGERRNTSIGSQFTYIFGKKDEAGLFVFCAQFSRAWFIVGVAARPSDVGDRQGYISHAENLALTY